MSFKDFFTSLTTLFDSRSLCDVTVIAGNNHNATEFRAHSCILWARSEYFRKQLTEMRRTFQIESVKIRVESIESQVFAIILRFMYTNRLPLPPPPPHDYIDLLIASDILQMEALASHIQDRMLISSKKWIKENFDRVLKETEGRESCKKLRTYALERSERKEREARERMWRESVLNGSFMNDDVKDDDVKDDDLKDDDVNGDGMNNGVKEDGVNEDEGDESDERDEDKVNAGVKANVNEMNEDEINEDKMNEVEINEDVVEQTCKSKGKEGDMSGVDEKNNITATLQSELPDEKETNTVKSVTQSKKRDSNDGLSVEFQTPRKKRNKTTKTVFEDDIQTRTSFIVKLRLRK